MNKYDGTEIGTYEWQVDIISSLLAASICGLGDCSSATMDQVELTLRKALGSIAPDVLQVLYHQINRAFTGCVDDVPNILQGRSSVECALQLQNNSEKEPND